MRLVRPRRRLISSAEGNRRPWTCSIVSLEANGANVKPWLQNDLFYSSLVYSLRCINTFEDSICLLASQSYRPRRASWLRRTSCVPSLLEPDQEHSIHLSAPTPPDEVYWRPPLPLAVADTWGHGRRLGCVSARRDLATCGPIAVRCRRRGAAALSSVVSTATT